MYVKLCLILLSTIAVRMNCKNKTMPYFFTMTTLCGFHCLTMYKVCLKIMNNCVVLGGISVESL